MICHVVEGCVLQSSIITESFLLRSMRHTDEVARTDLLALHLSRTVFSTLGHCFDLRAVTSRTNHSSTIHLPLPNFLLKQVTHATFWASRPYAACPNLRRVSPRLLPRMTFNFLRPHIVTSYADESEEVKVGAAWSRAF